MKKRLFITGTAAIFAALFLVGCATAGGVSGAEAAGAAASGDAPKIEMVQIAAVTITGSSSYGFGEKPGAFVAGRTVNLGAYKIAKYETTYEVWYEVKTWAKANGYSFANEGQEGSDGRPGAAPSAAKNEPVTNINWRDVMIWCNAYSEFSGKTPVYYADEAYTTVQKAATNGNGNATPADRVFIKADADGYRLPTEAEWETAARGGNPADAVNWGYKYAGSDTLDEVAWYVENSGITTYPVGGKAPNGAGIHDMSGNVWEWVYDWFDTITPATGTAGGGMAKNREVRGGQYENKTGSCEVVHRGAAVPGDKKNNRGFRVACN